MIGISSVAGDRIKKSNAHYGIAKRKISKYLKEQQEKLKNFNISILDVKPGFVRTKMTADMDLPKLLTAEPLEVGNIIYKARNKNDVIYVKWFWRYIMMIIKMIPEPIFRRLNL